MHIVVLVKQVPDSREIRIDPVENTLIREGVPAIINPFDLHGLEEALRFKDKAGAEVTVISMGPPNADKSMKQCISMGADRAILVSDRAFAGADTLATAYVLSEAVKKAVKEFGPVDAVFAGKQTLDGDTGQVGPGVACRLDYEQLTYVEKVVDINEKEHSITVHRHLEDGVEVVKTKTPAVLTVLQEMNKPRRASLPGVIDASQFKPTLWTVNDFENIDRSMIGLKGSPTVVGKTWVPEQRKIDTKMIEGDSTEAIAAELINALWETELPTKLAW